MTRFDLHIHSALSACGEDVLSPRLIVERAAARGLHLISVVDHNASAHVEPTLRLGADSGLTIIPGIEVATREEVHLLAYFPGLSELAEFQKLIDAHLPKLENNSELFGHQLIYDDGGEIVDLDRRLRLVGVDLGIDTLVAAIHEHAGRAVPAHIFRLRNGLLSQLGFIDPESRFDGLEIDWREWRKRGLRPGCREQGFPAISGSDSHFLEDIGRRFLEIEASPQSLRELAAIVLA